ncbi:TetR family transcriptional regulator [Streptomyces coeruleorubidus]|uniref:TetR/AcrR family transcriptional regulator n=1 Tax=Streptomyces coeruleorubidus TaxID=116188 RepID=UPI00237F60F9|nr:TetR/AcrR family transcriptional regulator [Streptomyces coeruleorubidus]WDV53025.1 TetR family transcriptional regulator [Streptomyces coeruleorubidus]
MPGRRDEVLDAAIEVLAEGGLRRLTYQAVDTAAGVPAGTTSNHFRSRDALVAGVVGHLEAQDRRDWERVAGEPTAEDPEAFVAALTHMIRHALGPARPRTAARYALILEGLARPAVRAPLSRAQDSLISWVAQWLATLGSPEPQEHCRVLFDYLDGMMFHQVVMPRAHFDPEPGIRLVLGALVQR